MSARQNWGQTPISRNRGLTLILETAAAWMLGILWILPLAYAVWTAFHAAQYSTHFVLFAPLSFSRMKGNAIPA